MTAKGSTEGRIAALERELNALRGLVNQPVRHARPRQSSDLAIFHLLFTTLTLGGTEARLTSGSATFSHSAFSVDVANQWVLVNTSGLYLASLYVRCIGSDQAPEDNAQIYMKIDEGGGFVTVGTPPLFVHEPHVDSGFPSFSNSMSGNVIFPVLLQAGDKIQIWAKTEGGSTFAIEQATLTLFG